MIDRLRLTLTFACADAAGIQAAVTGCLFEFGAFIEQDGFYGDPESGRFFGRIVFRAHKDARLDRAALTDGLAPIAERFGMAWQLNDNARRCPTVIAVSRWGHCLNDLLHRWASDALNIDI